MHLKTVRYEYIQHCYVCHKQFEFLILSLFLKIKRMILLLQELEELVKEKEKDLEKAEERGNALIRHEKGAACSVVKETLKGLNRSWAHLDHMVSFLDPLNLWLLSKFYCCALRHLLVSSPTFPIR